MKMVLSYDDNFPNLNDHKVCLRQILATDVESLIQISFYDGIQAKTLEEALAMQAKINKDQVDGNSIHWGIVDCSTHKIVGTCGYYRGFAQQQGELGCVLLPQYQGQGYMSAAMLLAIDFGLNKLGLKRIWAITNKENSKAVKLLERLDFVKIAALAGNEVEYELSLHPNHKKTSKR